MQINKTNNTNFQGRVLITNETPFKNIPLKSLINKAKHHAGSKDVTHDIYIGKVLQGKNFFSNEPGKILENQYAVTIRSSYKTKKQIDGIRSFSRESTVVVDKDAPNNVCSFDENGMQAELSKWLDGTKDWFQNIRKQEKQEIKIAKALKEQEKPKTLGAKLISLISFKNKKTT